MQNFSLIIIVKLKYISDEFFFVFIILDCGKLIYLLDFESLFWEKKCVTFTKKLFLVYYF